MSEHRQSLNDADRDDLRNRVESALAVYDIEGLAVHIGRDGSVAVSGLVADREVRQAVLDAAASAAGRPVDGGELGTEQQVEYPPDRLDAQSGEELDEDTAAVFGIGTEDRDGTEIDFNDDNVGTPDPMESAAEARPWTPPMDPVETPANNDEGIEITGGFATTALDEPTDEDPARLQTGDSEIEEDIRVALERDAATAGLDIDVRVRSGVVLLTGRVQSLDDVDAAEEVAGRVPGVIEVREQLAVERYEEA